MAVGREKLHTVLRELLGGDELAAAYLLMCIGSGVHTRKDGQAYGHVCVNMYGLPPSFASVPADKVRLSERFSEITSLSQALLFLLQSVKQVVLPLGMQIDSL